MMFICSNLARSHPFTPPPFHSTFFGPSHSPYPAFVIFITILILPNPRTKPS